MGEAYRTAKGTGLMAHFLADGILRQPARKWYSKRETDEIYQQGGYVVLTLAEQKPQFEKPTEQRKVGV